MLDLARGLSALGVGITLACPSPAKLENAARRESLPTLTIPKHGLVDWGAARTLARRLKSGQTNIVHAHNGRTALAAALAVRLAGRGRCVMTQHFLTPNHATQQGPKAALSGAAHHWVVGRMGRILAISEAVREAMLARGEAPSSKITVVPNGIAMPNGGNPVETRLSLGITADTPLIVCAARLEPEKDVASLLSAIKTTGEAVPNVRCLVAGEGTERSALEAQIKALGLEQCVSLLGFRADATALISGGGRICPAKPGGAVWAGASGSDGPGPACCRHPRRRAAGNRYGRRNRVSCPAAVAGRTGRSLDAPAVQPAAATARLGEAGQARFQSHFTASRMADATFSVYRSVCAA